MPYTPLKVQRLKVQRTDGDDDLLKGLPNKKNESNITHPSRYILCTVDDSPDASS